MKTEELIGKNIRELRKEKDLSQQDLADKTGIKRQYISELELGRRSPQITTLEKIAKELNIDINYLLKEHEED